MKKNRGEFIVFEGIDGSGKTTLAKKLTLNLKGINEEECWYTSEPFNFIFNEIENLSNKDKLDRFVDDRLFHIKIINQWLDNKTNVICDRYFISTLVYQGIDKETREHIKKVNETFLQPDLTIYIDTSPHICMDRIMRRNQKISSNENLKSLCLLKNAYDEEIAEYSKNHKVVTLENNRNFDLTYSKLRGIVTHHLTSKVLF